MENPQENNNPQPQQSSTQAFVMNPFSSNTEPNNSPSSNEPKSLSNINHPIPEDHNPKQSQAKENTEMDDGDGQNGQESEDVVMEVK